MMNSSYAVESKGTAFDFNPQLTAELAGDVFSVTFAKVIETFISVEFLLNTIEEEEEWGHSLKAQDTAWLNFTSYKPSTVCVQRQWCHMKQYLH